jgi:hypothetical protein
MFPVGVTLTLRVITVVVKDAFFSFEICNHYVGSTAAQYMVAALFIPLSSVPHVISILFLILM